MGQAWKPFFEGQEINQGLNRQAIGIDTIGITNEKNVCNLLFFSAYPFGNFGMPL